MEIGEDKQVEVLPGNCGFPCAIKASRSSRRVAKLVLESQCPQIKVLGQAVAEVSLEDLFLPLSHNPIFRQAEKSGCHLACPVPVAIIKSVEVAMGLAVAQPSSITFSPLTQEAE